MRRKGKNPERDLALGALLTSLFYPSQAASFALPGAGGAEFRFPRNLPRVAGVWLDGRFFGATMLVLLTVGYAAGRGGEGAQDPRLVLRRRRCHPLA